MSLMPWDAQAFDVLVPAMNAQHERLVAIMNTLYDRHGAGASKQELNSLLVQLRDATVAHFADEERFFDSVGFPGAAAHKRIHQKLVADFVRHYEAFAAGDGTLSKEFFNFLKLWLSAHIQHIDRKYGEHSAHQGAA